MPIRKNNKKPIAYEDYTVAQEELPYPIVLYPGFYGVFFGFRKDERTPIVFCSSNSYK